MHTVCVFILCLCTCLCMYKCTCVCVNVSLCVCAAVSEYASVRCAQKSPAVARYSQHQSDRRSQPPAHGRQRPQRPLRQIQNGAPEVQEQGKHTPIGEYLI